MPKFDTRVRTGDPRKHGKAAVWNWELYLKGKPLPIRSGRTIGAQAKAYEAAERAKMAYLERQSPPQRKKRGKRKRDAK